MNSSWILELWSALHREMDCWQAQAVLWWAIVRKVRATHGSVYCALHTCSCPLLCSFVCACDCVWLYMWLHVSGLCEFLGSVSLGDLSVSMLTYILGAYILVCISGVLYAVVWARVFRLITDMWNICGLIHTEVSCKARPHNMRSDFLANYGCFHQWMKCCI